MKPLYRAMALSAAVAALNFCGPAHASDLRGFVRALDDAVIATELNARVVLLPFQEGDSFQKGDVLIGFECAKHVSDLRAAQAEQRLNAVALESSEALNRRGAGGSFDVRQNRARLEKAQAAVEGLQARVKECEIRAPFAGRIGEMKIRLHEMTTPNQPLFRIVSASRLEVDLVAPSSYMVWLKIGRRFEARIEETGQTKGARVTRMPAAVDPVSQTIKITATLDDSVDVLPGMAVSSQLAPPTQP